MSEYFVLARTLWKGDTWGAIAGPFTDKNKAQEVAEFASNDGWSEPVWDEVRKAYWAPTQDLKRVVNTRVVSKTQMQREYKIKYDDAIMGIAVMEADKRYWERVIEEANNA